MEQCEQESQVSALNAEGMSSTISDTSANISRMEQQDKQHETDAVLAAKGVDVEAEFSRLHRPRRQPRRLDENPESTAELSLPFSSTKKTWQNV